MHKLLKYMILALLLVGLPLGSDSIAEQDLHIVFQPGMTYFDAGTESFVVVTTQPVSISFGDVNHYHVFGSIEPLDTAPESDLVKLLWLRDGSDPITLFFGDLQGRTVVFNSEAASTGHNEKGEQD